MHTNNPTYFVDDGRYPSLAEEISTVAEALTGAPVHAKETVLKILERLTQRLDRAERDRDMAIGRYRELQARFEQLEEELSKKRGELRELLRQDNRIYHGSASRDKEDETGPVNGRYSDTNGNGESGKKKGASVIVDNGNGETEARLDEDLASSSGRNKTSDNSSIAKMEAKTPERPISEEAMSPRASSLQICLDTRSPDTVKAGPEPGPNNNEPRISNKLKVMLIHTSSVKCTFPTDLYFDPASRQMFSSIDFEFKIFFCFRSRIIFRRG